MGRGEELVEEKEEDGEEVIFAALQNRSEAVGGRHRHGNEVEDTWNLRGGHTQHRLILNLDHFGEFAVSQAIYKVLQLKIDPLREGRRFLQEI